MKTVARSQIVGFCCLGAAAVLALMPLHAVLTVWAGSNFGQYAAWRAWKEVLIAVLLLPAAWLLAKNEALRKSWRHSALVWTTLAYAAWQLLWGLWAWHEKWVRSVALVDGWATDLRFLACMLVCWIVAAHTDWLRTRWKLLLLAPAVAVVSFGLLQATVLPADVLRHVGYGPHTILPFETVDNKAAYVRVQSTLRGPNPLGAYVVIVIAALVVLCARMRKYRLWFLAFLAVAAVVLGFTYSRSAYIGALLAGGVALWMAMPGWRPRKLFLLCAGALLLSVAGAFLVLHGTSTVQNTLFHTDKNSASAHSSNQQRAGALEQGLRDVVRQPLGRGPGSAGPASAHNATARIAENYYLQIGQEVGWPGLALFIAINVLVVQALWRQRADALAITLLASFAGITAINMLSHAWADDTLGLLWWGFAGIALATSAKRSTDAR